MALEKIYVFVLLVSNGAFSVFKFLNCSMLPDLIFAPEVQG